MKLVQMMDWDREQSSYLMDETSVRLYNSLMLLFFMTSSTWNIHVATEVAVGDNGSSPLQQSDITINNGLINFQSDKHMLP